MPATIPVPQPNGFETINVASKAVIMLPKTISSQTGAYLLFSLIESSAMVIGVYSELIVDL